MPLMPLTPPMSDPKKTTIPTITHLVTTTSLTPLPKNHVRCKNCNPDRLLPDDNINQFYNYTTYNLLICNKFNPDQILIGDEDNDEPNIL